MRLAAALAAAVIAYPVISWFVRLALTVATLPLAGRVRDSSPRFALPTIRVVCGLVCGGAGVFGAAWIARRLGASATWALPALLLAYVAFAHLPGLRRLAGGPQVGGEALGFAGEALGVVAAAVARWPW